MITVVLTVPEYIRSILSSQVHTYICMYIYIYVPTLPWTTTATITRRLREPKVNVLGVHLPGRFACEICIAWMEEFLLPDSLFPGFQLPETHNPYDNREMMMYVRVHNVLTYGCMCGEVPPPRSS